VAENYTFDYVEGVTTFTDQKTFWHSPICKRIPPFLTLETVGFERELGPRPIKVGEESIKNVSSGK